MRSINSIKKSYKYERLNEQNISKYRKANQQNIKMIYDSLFEFEHFHLI